jgi:Chaperone of endosialidase
MSFVAAAVVGAGVVGSVASSVISAGAASDAANAQAQSAANAQQISQQEFNTITQQNQPFMQSGYGALSALDWGLGITPQTATGGAPGSTPNPTLSGFNQGYNPQTGYQIGPGGGITQMIPSGGAASPTPQIGAAGPSGLGFGSLTQPLNMSNWQQLSPAYNFQKQQGMQGVLNADTSGQGALSGAAQKDLINYNQNLANTSFNNAFNQYQTQQGNIFSRLSGIAQLGQSSANNTGQQGTALAGQAAQSATNIGTAQAGGIVGSANAISGGLNSVAPWLAYGAGQNPWGVSASQFDTENPSNFQDFTSSDRRLKRDIRRIGATDSGLPLYVFRYLDSEQLHVGVMADEVQAVIPDAVITDDQGFLRVNYGVLR